MITVMCRFQDGAATANNPAALALAEARALWPDTPVDVLVSIGSGDTPPARRERSVSTYLETGNVLIESATDTQRIAAALATLAPLVPGLRYFRCAAASGPDATSGTMLIKQAHWPRHVWAGVQPDSGHVHAGLCKDARQRTTAGLEYSMLCSVLT